MTNQLIILNRCNSYAGEGFFKFEDAYSKMTVAFKSANKEKYYWYADKNYGVFENKTNILISSPVKSAVKNCGIFYEENNICYPILYWGDLDILCEEFEFYTKKKTLQTSETVPEENIIKTFEINDSSAQITTQSENIPASETFVPARQSGENFPESFWDINSDKIEKQLNTLPEDSDMASLIPGSKWVKADDYLLGVIYDEFSVPLYICYGFDLPWGETPPEKLNGYCQWIPKDCARPHGKGYWVIYINAKTGERVK